MKMTILGMCMAFVGLTNFSTAAEHDANCDDSVTGYTVCRDQKQIYDNALAQAKSSDKPVVIIFGSEECETCASLHKTLQSGNLKDMASIAGVAIYNSSQETKAGVDEAQAIPASMALFEQLKKNNVEVFSPALNLPLLALLNPKTGKVAFRPASEIAEDVIKDGYVVGSDFSNQNLAAAVQELIEKTK